jgi:hypothetical protein
MAYPPKGMVLRAIPAGFNPEKVFPVAAKSSSERQNSTGFVEK